MQKETQKLRKNFDIHGRILIIEKIKYNLFFINIRSRS